MKGSETIYVMDCIVAKPGVGAAVYRHYVENYAPVAKARGLTLEHGWVSPPVWLEGDQSNTLYFIWSIAGVTGYWGAEAQARWDPATPDFWFGLESIILSRTRQVMSQEQDMAGLCDV